MVGIYSDTALKHLSTPRRCLHVGDLFGYSFGTFKHIEDMLVGGDLFGYSFETFKYIEEMLSWWGPLRIQL
jgi:hypothetical protein